MTELWRLEKPWGPKTTTLRPEQNLKLALNKTVMIVSSTAFLDNFPDIICILGWVHTAPKQVELFVIYTCYFYMYIYIYIYIYRKRERERERESPKIVQNVSPRGHAVTWPLGMALKKHTRSNHDVPEAQTCLKESKFICLWISLGDGEVGGGRRGALMPWENTCICSAETSAPGDTTSKIFTKPTQIHQKNKLDLR